LGGQESLSIAGGEEQTGQAFSDHDLPGAQGGDGLKYPAHGVWTLPMLLSKVSASRAAENFDISLRPSNSLMLEGLIMLRIMQGLAADLTGSAEGPRPSALPVSP
jgi:hypothetical protein